MYRMNQTSTNENSQQIIKWQNVEGRMVVWERRTCSVTRGAGSVASRYETGQTTVQHCATASTAEHYGTTAYVITFNGMLVV